MTKRDISDGFRRILYDAMVLSASLRYIRESKSYRRGGASRVDGYVEAQTTNALIQIRSMIDFLGCSGKIYEDTMTVVQFFGCSKQSIAFPERKASNKYAAHKSWDAVSKDASAGARQLSKKEIFELGMKVLAGFDRFRTECTRETKIKSNPHARRYEEILRENMSELKRLGP
ncbi:hypothetical protein ACFL5Q_02810 [Planctomycetota bacterium]